MSRSLPGARVRLDRRALLRRTGALAAVPLVATATAAAGTATASTSGTAAEPEGPECLADLIDEGVVKRADLLA